MQNGAGCGERGGGVGILFLKWYLRCNDDANEDADDKHF